MSVYFAEAGGHIKIGYSADPMKRADTITRHGARPDSIPFGTPVRLIGWVPGDQRVEGIHHARFNDQRVKGEWFRGINHEAIRELIWADPRGVDIRRMSMLAVLVCLECPEATRDEVVAAGIPLMATPLRATLDRMFGRAS